MGDIKNGSAQIPGLRSDAIRAIDKSQAELTRHGNSYSGKFIGDTNPDRNRRTPYPTNYKENGKEFGMYYQIENVRISIVYDKNEERVPETFHTEGANFYDVNNQMLNEVKKI